MGSAYTSTECPCSSRTIVNNFRWSLSSSTSNIRANGQFPLLAGVYKAHLTLFMTSLKCGKPYKAAKIFVSRQVLQNIPYEKMVLIVPLCLTPPSQTMFEASPNVPNPHASRICNCHVWITVHKTQDTISVSTLHGKIEQWVVNIVYSFLSRFNFL